MKVLLGIQAYETFRGIHCNADEAKEYNRKRYGVDFYGNLTGVRVPEVTRDYEWEQNKRNFDIPMKERFPIKEDRTTWDI